MNEQNVHLQIVMGHGLTEQAYSSARNYVSGNNLVLFVDTEYAGIEIK